MDGRGRTCCLPRSAMASLNSQSIMVSSSGCFRLVRPYWCVFQIWLKHTHCVYTCARAPSQDPWQITQWSILRLRKSYHNSLALFFLQHFGGQLQGLNPTSNTFIKRAADVGSGCDWYLDSEETNRVFYELELERMLACGCIYIWMALHYLMICKAEPNEPMTLSQCAKQTLALMEAAALLSPWNYERIKNIILFLLQLSLWQTRREF